MLKNLFSKPIEAAKARVSEYVDLKLEQLKLSTIEKASPIAASIVIDAVVEAHKGVSFLFVELLYNRFVLSGLERVFLY